MRLWGGAVFNIITVFTKLYIIVYILSSMHTIFKDIFKIVFNFKKLTYWVKGIQY